MMVETIQALDEYIIMLVIGVCIILGMVIKALTSIITGISRERTRREIAAYIAEGSMSPEQGERLMKADINDGKQA